MNIRNKLVGLALLVVGILLLARNFGWFSFSIASIAPFWPLLWILAGLFAFIDPQKRVMNGATVTLILLSIPLLFYAQTLKWQSNFVWDQEDGEDMELQAPSENSRQTFQVQTSDTVSVASFSITSGLGKYQVKESEIDLFGAEMKGKHRQLKMAEGMENGIYQISLSESKGKTNNVHSSDLILRFHTRPTWDMKWEVGLGEVDLDLRDFKIRDLELSAGLAEVDIKIGKKQKETRIQLKSGLADTEIAIPSAAGGEIRTESALSSFDFDGFEEIEKGVYRTRNFNESTQKVWIQIESGFAAVQVTRYD